MRQNILHLMRQPPGEQAQFDWSPYTVLINGELTIIYIYSYINSFSRYQIFEVSLSQNQAAIFEALEDSISRVDLIIIDELGYLALNKQTAKLFFQLISKRYETGSIIITTNKPFEGWGEVFNDDVAAAAVLDRLLHHSYPFLINDKSFRLKNIMKSN